MKGFAQADKRIDPRHQSSCDAAGRVLFRISFGAIRLDGGTSPTQRSFQPLFCFELERIGQRSAVRHRQAAVMGRFKALRVLINLVSGNSSTGQAFSFR